MNLNKKFKKDLEFGNAGEKIVAMYMAINGMTIVSDESGNNKDYDIVMYSPKADKNLYMEVKTDNYVDDNNDTGNIAIEIRYRGKPSGISTTKADWWIYYMPDISSSNLWMMECSKLKRFIKENIQDLKVVKGGDNNWSELVLIPRKKYAQYFGVDTIKKTKWNEK
tara:strand:- start:3875 stop:4372 length:498 start_codon:yes stop_codon:yes gene_type:complete